MNLKIGKGGAVFLSTLLISVGVFGGINLFTDTPPVANAGIDQIVEMDTIVQFDGSASVGSNLNYTWYLRTNGDVGYGVNPTHTFTEEGIYEVGLLVRETTSYMMDLDIVKITVRNQIPVADAGQDMIVNEDDEVLFDAGGTLDSESDMATLVYEWDFADGMKGQGISPTHVYTRSGTYPVVLTVTDRWGAVGVDIVTIVVNNPAPAANAGSDKTVNEGEYVYFDGSGSTDTPSDVPTLRYDWNFGDGGSQAANVWKDDGTYPVTLTATDDDGTQSQDTLDVSVQNVDPFICVDDAYLQANVTLRASGEKWHDVKFYLNESGIPREEFYIFREASDPKEQEDTRYDMKLNLGELWTAEVYYTPLDDPINGQLQGDTPVWIILEFDNGVTRKISHNFNVNHPDTWYWNFALNDHFFQNPQPVIHFGYTTYDPGMDSETVTWECGRNTVSKYYEASTFPTFIKDTIDYTPEKMENITITVDDDDGGTYNVTLSFTESMLDGLSPKVSAGDNQSAIEDDTVTFAGSAETTVSRSISNYQWEFGDGASASGAAANHIYRFSGTYYAVLRAWDDLGNVGIDIVKVEVANANPTAEAGLDKVAAEDSIVIFDGSGTTDTPSDISSLVYAWNFGDGGVGYDINSFHVYSNAGTYSITLTVTDNDGATSTDTLVITVNNLAPTSALAGPDRIIYGTSMSIEFIGVGFDTFSDVLGLVYSWNFGDGTPGTGKVTTHIYTVASTYTVTLTVTDHNNAVATDTCTVSVGIDSDGDNLGDTFETGIGTDAGNWDSDTDCISDYWEIYTYDTDPALSDTDNDGLIDWYEIAYLGYDVDVDDDGLMCPRDWDSDGDWIKDGEDPNPLMYNYADGTEASGPVVISVNENLGVYVVIEYEDVSTVKANIVEITPIKELNAAVGHYVDISTTSTVPFTAEIRITYSMPLPPSTLEEQLAMYRWHGANNRWIIEDNTVVDVDKDFVWSKVTHFCDFCIGNSNFQYSDNDGLCDWYERNTSHPNFSDDLVYLNGKTNELIDDTDGDGLYDGWVDFNGNGIFDDGETKGELQYYTSPLNADTDDDDVNDNVDIDPLVDLQVTVKISEICKLDPVDDWPNEGAEFYAWIICSDGNSEQMLKLPDRTDRDAFEIDSDHLYPEAYATFDVADDSELIGFMIILFDDDGGLDRTLEDTMASTDDPCDISLRQGGGGGDPANWGYSALLLNYNLKTDQWSGEDYPGDSNGYGHVSGEEDLNTGDQDDCELWFDITQNDYDGDGLTWWQEVEEYGTDPTEFDRTWLFMVYMAGDSNLEEELINNINQMELVGSSDLVNIVVQLDRGIIKDISNGDWIDARRYYITHDTDLTRIGSEEIQNVGEVNTGDTQELVDFVRWANTSYSANTHVLILGGHGDGFQGVLFDSANTTNPDGVDHLDMEELKDAMIQTKCILGKNIDVVGFDACLMGTIEVGYQLRNTCDIIISSENIVPSTGWPYQTILTDLIENTDMEVTALASNIVNKYVLSYADDLFNQDVTLSAFFTDCIANQIVPAVNHFAQQLILALPQWQEEILEARDQAEEYGRAEYAYLDLYDFAIITYLKISNTDVRTSALDVMNAITNCCINEDHLPDVPESHGISIYWQVPSGTTKIIYENTDFAIDTEWDNLLQVSGAGG